MTGTADSTSASWTLAPQGDRCLLVSLGSGIDVAVGRRCARVAQALRAAAIQGVTDIIPTFNAVAVYFEPARFSGGSHASEQSRLSGDSHASGQSRLSGGRHASAPAPSSGGHAGLRARIEQVLRESGDVVEGEQTGRTVEIPVLYGGEYGPDLESVAAHCGLTTDEVISLHSGETVYVFMLGFAPGAAYIGVHDERLAIPRRSTPRTRLPAGSVAIANRQSMIYPNESPGGWHILGRTPVIPFDPLRDPVTLMAPGDSVRFYPIDEAAFHEMQAGAKPKGSAGGAAARPLRSGKGGKG